MQKTRSRAKSVKRTKTTGVEAVNPRLAEAAIAARAYELFMRRGGTHGDDLADWFAAEHDLVSEQ